jgi:2-keto-3-deoxy-L-rhamnonate aldolase RhmA
MLEIAARFRERVRARERLLGVFIKTPAYQMVEVLALAGMDFVALDAEHAPFDPEAIDRCVLAGLAYRIPILVRVPDGGAVLASACADMGAAGIIFPHVTDTTAARAAVDAVKFANGRRGLSPSPRAAGYGRMSFTEYAQANDRSTSVWAQIEDPSALDALDAIAEEADIDCLFVGRVDLAHALALTSLKAPALAAAVDRVLSVAVRLKKAAAIFVSSPEEAVPFAARGATVFVVGSDQSALHSRASSLRATFAEMLAR